MYAPFVGLGHPEVATIVPALFGAAVLILVVATAWRITGMPWAAAVAGLLLLSSPEYWARSSNLPAYQPSVFFGYLGLLLTAIALHSPRRSRVFAIVGGVALALSVYSFTIGLLFLPAALLLALAWKGRWRPVLLSLSTAAALLLPFAVWHVAIAGVRKAFYYPHSFISANHLEHLDSFYSRPDYDLGQYATEALPDMLVGAAPIWLWLLAVAGLVMIGKARGVRLSAAIAAVLVIALIPHAVVGVLNSRYTYPLVPGLALLAGTGLALVVQSMARRQALRGLSILVVSGIALAALITASMAMSSHLNNVRDARAAPLYAGLRAVASKVDDDRALLVRAANVQVLMPHNQVYTTNFISEDEYLDYVLWQDEESVRQMFARRDIGWVVFQNNVDRWERDFNMWTLAATGDPPRYHICLPQSAGFTEVYDGHIFTLYRVNREWLEAESASGSCPLTAVEHWSSPGAWRRGAAPP
jgi:4-amino-4-deoxy-L-arabinose transferase-like glycosyltransferase